MPSHHRALCRREAPHFWCKHLALQSSDAEFASKNYQQEVKALLNAVRRQIRRQRRA